MGKYCTNCGTELKNAKFCPECGTQNVDLPQQNIYYQPQRIYYAPGTHPYHNLGGILAVIVVISYIVGIVAFINAIILFIKGIDVFKYSSWLPDGLVMCLIYAIFGGVALYIASGVVVIKYANYIREKDSLFLYFIQKTSVIMMIVSFVYYIILILWLKKYDYFNTISSGDTTVRLFILLFVWVVSLIFGSMYFTTSVRVRTYMGSDDYLRCSLFNQNAYSPIPADGSDLVKKKDINNSYNTKSIHTQMWICGKCGASNSINQRYCINCGKSQNIVRKKTFAGIDEWRCSKCGKINKNYTGTCACGQLKRNNK